MAKELAETSASDRKWWFAHQYDKILAPFPSVKCFELSLADELITSLAQEAQKKSSLAESVAFLPAPATWLEFRNTQGGPLSIEAVLLVQKNDTTASCVSVGCYSIGGGIGFTVIPAGDLPLLGAADPDEFALNSAITMEELGNAPRTPGTAYFDASKLDLDAALALEQNRAYWLYAALAIINSPKIVDRSTRPPSSGLQKRLARRFGAPFQLLPWHEIFLDIRPPTTGEERGEGGRLTGPKALHFCRSFLRIRLGKLERVRAHWRGDPALGLSQASYRVMH